MAFTNFKNFIWGLFPKYFGINDSNKISDPNPVNGVYKGTLERFMKIFGQELDEEVIPLIENFLNTTDPEECEERFLAHIANSVGNPPNIFTDSEIDKYRELLRYISSIYKIKGTKLSYELFFALLGFNVSIYEEEIFEYYYDTEIYYNGESEIGEPYIYDEGCPNCSYYWLTFSRLDGSNTPLTSEELLLLEIAIEFLEPINANLLYLDQGYNINDSINSSHFEEEITLTVYEGQIYIYDDETNPIYDSYGIYDEPLIISQIQYNSEGNINPLFELYCDNGSVTIKVSVDYGVEFTIDWGVAGGGDVETYIGTGNPQTISHSYPNPGTGEYYANVYILPQNLWGIKLINTSIKGVSCNYTTWFNTYLFVEGNTNLEYIEFNQVKEFRIIYIYNNPNPLFTSLNNSIERVYDNFRIVYQPYISVLDLGSLKSVNAELIVGNCALLQHLLLDDLKYVGSLANFGVNIFDTNQVDEILSIMKNIIITYSKKDLVLVLSNQTPPATPTGGGSSSYVRGNPASCNPDLYEIMEIMYGHSGIALTD